MRFLNHEATLAWLGQFAPDEQHLMRKMLRKMQRVSRDEFHERLIELIVERGEAGPGPVGLYAERELPRRLGKPHRLFKEARGKAKRAFGVGPKPVQPVRAYDADVGSEGLVAQLVSELCRLHPGRYLNHPGPNTIREKRVRRFLLVTDFVGSGRRASTYLEAAWRVRSVRSWWSARRKCGMGLEVVAYSGTEAGKGHVAAHPSRPIVSLVVPCATVRNSFAGYNAREIEAICRRYMPGRPEMPSLGFGGAGALIAFAHGAPNNTPLVLHRKTGAWLPLFPQRTTAGARTTFGVETGGTDAIRARLIDMRHSRLAASGVIATADPRVQAQVVLLAALSSPSRSHDTISLRTGLTLTEVDLMLRKAFRHGWIDGRNRLTDQGHAELDHLKRFVPTSEALPRSVPDDYCPRQLRAPVRLV